MFRFVRTRGKATVVMAALVAGAIAGCGEDSVVPPDDDGGETGITAEVTADGEAVAGVTVRLYEAGATSPASTEETGTNGTAEFTGLAAGSYELEVVVPAELSLDDGESARKTVSVTEGRVSQVSFGLVSDLGGGGDVVEIRVINFQFDPAEVTISPGTTVRWVSETTTLHTVTPDGHSEWTRTELNSVDETFVHVFEGAGTFPYYCEPHESQGMTGTITVQ